MELRLYDEDLKPEHKDCNASNTKFEKFNERVQAAIRIVGKATYHARDTYNVIYPPKTKTFVKPTGLPVELVTSEAAGIEPMFEDNPYQRPPWRQKKF